MLTTILITLLVLIEAVRLNFSLRKLQVVILDHFRFPFWRLGLDKSELDRKCAALATYRKKSMIYKLLLQLYR